MSDIEPSESAVKAELDRLEFEEQVPELQRDAAVINLNDRGVPVFVPPNHPKVREFIKELAARDLREREIVHTFRDGTELTQPIDPDLPTARRKLRTANESYQTRIAYRFGLAHSPVKINGRAARLVSLSAILIARSEAKFWHKIVTKLEVMERNKRQDRRASEENKRRRFASALVAAFRGEVS